MAAPTNAASVKKALANSEPSTHGTSRTSGDVRPKSAKWAEPDIDQVAVTQSRFYEFTPWQATAGRVPAVTRSARLSRQAPASQVNHNGIDDLHRVRVGQTGSDKTRDR